MHNIGTVSTYKMHNIGTVPMFKVHNVGTLKCMIFVLSWNLDCLAKMTARCISLLLESSRTHFLGQPSPIPSGMDCMDEECTVQNLPFEKLVFTNRISTWMWALLLFQLLLSKYSFLIPSSVPKLK